MHNALKQAQQNQKGWWTTREELKIELNMNNISSIFVHVMQTLHVVVT